MPLQGGFHPISEAEVRLRAGSKPPEKKAADLGLQSPGSFPEGGAGRPPMGGFSPGLMTLRHHLHC